MFVTFEGPEGAGKSTVVAEIARRVRDTKREIVTTREPGAGNFGAKIREIVLHGEDMNPRAELFLFLADRSQHVSTLIRPALSEGTLVICDRYTDSTLVYQGLTRGLDVEFVQSANRFATENLTPDRTYLLDIAPEVGLARVTHKDRLDSQPLSFHESVRNGFLQLANTEPTRWVVIDASQQLSEVVDAVWADLSSRLGT